MLARLIVRARLTARYDARGRVPASVRFIACARMPARLHAPRLISLLIFLVAVPIREQYEYT